MDYKNLGRRISRRRRELHLTQEQLAEQVDLSVSFLGHIERGTRILSLDTLVRICMALGTTADDLLGVFVDGPARHLPPDWSPERCDAVLALLDDAHRITKAMKTSKSPCQTCANPL